jgi:Uncharacterised nucleotidyltransferase
VSAPTAAAWEPSPQELLLLRAGLWRGEAAREAWRQWRRGEGVEIDASDPARERLLPLAYRNLGPLPDTDPDAELLRTIYRESWAGNQRSAGLGRRAIEALRNARVEPMALKGCALVESAYRDPGARPAGDFDLAVRPERIPEAVRALCDANLTPGQKDPVRWLNVHHSLGFADPSGAEVDLHRRILWRPGLEEEFWGGAVDLQVAGVRVRALCPADQLLHVCVHGAAWNPMRPIRWAADAFKVIEASGEDLDWERLVRMAERGRLTLPLRDTLSYLARELEAPVPAGALAALQDAPVSAGEERAHQVLSRSPSSGRSLSMLWWFWERHRAQAAVDGTRPGAIGFLRYMQEFWGLSRPTQIPTFALRRLLRRRGVPAQREAGGNRP